MEKIPFHGKAPFKRLLMFDNKMFPDSDSKIRHIAVHMIEKMPEYSELHSHKFDEINLILSEKERLKYEIVLEDEKYKVASPATVYIPRGVRHSAQAIEGEGIFICLTIIK